MRARYRARTSGGEVKLKSTLKKFNYKGTDKDAYFENLTFQKNYEISGTPNIELLSPAGNYDCAKAAIEAGADAIYMGGEKYSARAYAESSTDNSLIDSIKLVKKNNKKFYLTVNTLFKQKEIKEIFLYLDPIVYEGIDAFIVQDLGVAMLLKEKYPNVNLHASTQMAITSSKGINLVKQLGFTQVVLARELSLKEIKNIKKEVGNDIKLEAFVHGSMCYSYSGCCLMSSFIGNESGNRGRCKGPCRLQYHTVGVNAKVVGANTDTVRANAEVVGANAEVVGANACGALTVGAKHREPAPYILSMKDMCSLAVLQNLISAGITSFKIEGRMRKPNYVFGVTKTYRKYLDSIINKSANLNIINDEKYLLSLYNKGGFTNYYNKHNGYDMIQLYERK